MAREYEEFYGQFFEELHPDMFDEARVECPFHVWNAGKDDDSPSMYINLTSGKYDCKSCPERQDAYFSPRGDAIEFVRAWYDIDFFLAREIVTAYNDGVDIPFPISGQDVSRWKTNLVNMGEQRTRLMEKRYITEQTLDAFNVGWDGERYTIPIENYRDDIVNVRRYALDRSKDTKKIVSYPPYHFVTDDDERHSIQYGHARLWPHSTLQRKGVLYLMAGEWDTILALQLEMAAICSTGGENTWKNEWDQWFVGRDVVIVYDIDKAGRTGADKVARALIRVAKSVKILNLPIDTPKNADFTDYVGQGGTRSSIEYLVEQTPAFAPAGRSIESPTTLGETLGVTPMARSLGNPEYHHKRVTIEAQVVGKDYHPFTIPKEGEVVCNAGRSDNPNCNKCVLFDNNGRMSFRFSADHDLLRLIDVPDEKQSKEMKELVGIPPRCGFPEFRTTSYQNVERVRITPNIVAGYVNGANGDDEHSLQLAYYAYGAAQEPLQANRAYKLVGARLTEPKRQEALHLIDEVSPLADTIATFELTSDVYETLTRFRPSADDSLADRIDAVAHALAINVCHVYGREELITAFLLLYCSVQQFYFLGSRVDNGLLELMVIGDTRTGKSESAAALARWIQLGDIATAENSSYAGLVGGIQTSGDGSRAMITWGKIPQNDMRLLFIDEVSGLGTEAIARMSGVRSSRIADITKIQQAKTYARTRLCWMSNPLSSRRLQDYSFGVEAVMELMGKPEDVARFDFAVACAAGEVPNDIINSRPHDATPLDFEATDLRNLVLFAWSRRAEHILITREAEDAILAAAQHQGNLYSNAIPLVEAANQRIKLARLAVACAVLSFSASIDGVVTVTPEHVQWATNFLDTAYAKPSLDYRGFSADEKAASHVAEESREAITTWIKRQPAMAPLIQRQTYFSARDLEEQLELSSDYVKLNISTLAKSRMIERTKWGYKKTPAFIALLKETLAAKPPVS